MQTLFLLLLGAYAKFKYNHRWPKLANERPCTYSLHKSGYTTVQIKMTSYILKPKNISTNEYE